MPCRAAPPPPPPPHSTLDLTPTPPPLFNPLVYRLRTCCLQEFLPRVSIVERSQPQDHQHYHTTTTASPANSSSISTATITTTTSTARSRSRHHRHSHHHPNSSDPRSSSTTSSFPNTSSSHSLPGVARREPRSAATQLCALFDDETNSESIPSSLFSTSSSSLSALNPSPMSATSSSTTTSEQDHQPQHQQLPSFTPNHNDFTPRNIDLPSSAAPSSSSPSSSSSLSSFDGSTLSQWQPPVSSIPLSQLQTVLAHRFLQWAISHDIVNVPEKDEEEQDKEDQEQVAQDREQGQEDECSHGMELKQSWEEEEDRDLKDDRPWLPNEEVDQQQKQREWKDEPSATDVIDGIDQTLALHDDDGGVDDSDENKKKNAHHHRHQQQHQQQQQQQQSSSSSTLSRSLSAAGLEWAATHDLVWPEGDYYLAQKTFVREGVAHLKRGRRYIFVEPVLGPATSYLFPKRADHHHDDDDDEEEEEEEEEDEEGLDDDDDEHDIIGHNDNNVGYEDVEGGITVDSGVAEGQETVQASTGTSVGAGGNDAGVTAATTMTATATATATVGLVASSEAQDLKNDDVEVVESPSSSTSSSAPSSHHLHPRHRVPSLQMLEPYSPLLDPSTDGQDQFEYGLYELQHVRDVRHLLPHQFQPTRQSFLVHLDEDRPTLASPVPLDWRRPECRCQLMMRKALLHHNLLHVWKPTPPVHTVQDQLQEAEEEARMMEIKQKVQMQTRNWRESLQTQVVACG